MTSIERAKPADQAAIETLLVAADPPLTGLELAIATAVVARDGEAFAAESGIETLFLLTETAEEWFPRLGYSASTRGTVPATLAASPEFTDACPDSAAVFRKSIAAG